jgi:cytoskeletal protein CcmA (bactofilin family)
MSTVQAGEVIVRGTLRGKITAGDRLEIHSCGQAVTLRARSARLHSIWVNDRDLRAG